MTHDPSDAAARAARLSERFEATGGFTIGAEEEVMILDPHTLDLTPRSEELLHRVAGDGRFMSELPAAQAEIVCGPHQEVDQVAQALGQARIDLRTAAGHDLAIAAGGFHPFAQQLGALRTEPRRLALLEDYGTVARRQLVAALQVHVAIGGAQRSLAVYNALRCHLPELLALAANAPYIGGEDSGLATVRPTIAIQLPRQGIPPRLSSWEHLLAELSWGARAGTVTDAGRWWWELRPHLEHGTLELRVCDAQTTVADAAAIIAFVQALCAHLAARHDAGAPAPDVPDWRIAENRWSAIRHGVEGTLADLQTGEPVPARRRLRELVETVRPHAERLGGARWLARVTELIEVNGAMRQRRLGREQGMHGLMATLRDEFAPAPR